MTGLPNADQIEAWNGDSGRSWATDPDRRDALLAPVGDALLAAVRLSAAEQVLDIGCGCGATTLEAARRVAPSGAAHGIDISTPMLDVARDRARRQGVTNADFERADAQTQALPVNRFDAAISRFGTMFFDDPVAAFANIASSISAGGRLCIATWQPLAANEWLTLPGAILQQYGDLPEAAGGTGMFAQSDPAALTTTLTDAGFEAVEVAPREVGLRLGSDPAEAADYLVTTGPGRAVLDAVDDEVRPVAVAAVRAAMDEVAIPDGVHLGAAIWLTTARPRGPRPR
jgi:SAM-dependent methyltransferase